MSTPTKSTTPGGAAAERHERDVLAILTELREERRVVDAVIDVAFELTLRRGETTRSARPDFVTWSRSVVASARSGKDPAADWSEALDTLLDGYLAIAGAADTTAATVTDRVTALDERLGGSLTAPEQHIADLVAGVLIGSVSMWSDPDGAAKKAGGGIDKSQVARADVMGAITGAAGAAAATWWSGPVSGGAVASGTVTGAVLGSAVDMVMQDNANDAIEDAEPEGGRVGP
ncbi:hypothetical protein GCM10010112_00150 [Actinoplanes lobatus]|uniref:Uncharacterized protein n=1 Tax=Actinoplanes lobatus TaxID=113568 RepID=A0A7W7MDP1_9ACTN|nr:hypothetical protein [Actinoplanes lobatus]MBB4746434.1 hypothetical protein [Actinoplanes lobatus]GGN52427.1 hypothetical protein GCM10010112_00150 [Actinoplanes lobatus]GIE45628.1 hypothetical protein Alo02nite_85260 [Actinoplanes lobatus]